ncbi:hypothetical protein TIFTF001_045103 [Ficus carica]|uniref:Uncharacterized protein n=1 Tax=Ficus carica TaxID=3494 RepID=A0AA88CIS8_FICCA|nr:hypothetical protein TIFTF001_045101 [Ficus carica]GMN18940.1 hypothetical protein TIFTF001_045103 [Ficus carica]
MMWRAGGRQNLSQGKRWNRDLGQRRRVSVRILAARGVDVVISTRGG